MGPWLLLRCLCWSVGSCLLRCFCWGVGSCLQCERCAPGIGRLQVPALLGRLPQVGQRAMLSSVICSVGRLGISVECLSEQL